MNANWCLYKSSKYGWTQTGVCTKVVNMGEGKQVLSDSFTFNIIFVSINKLIEMVHSCFELKQKGLHSRLVLISSDLWSGITCIIISQQVHFCITFSNSAHIRSLYVLCLYIHHMMIHSNMWRTDGWISISRLCHRKDHSSPTVS